MQLKISYEFGKGIHGYFYIREIEKYFIYFYSDALIIQDVSGKLSFESYCRLPYKNISELGLFENPTGSNNELSAEIDNVDYETTGMVLEDEFNNKHIDPFSSEGQEMWDDKFIENIKSIFKRNQLKWEEKNRAMNQPTDGSIIKARVVQGL